MIAKATDVNMKREVSISQSVLRYHVHKKGFEHNAVSANIPYIKTQKIKVTVVAFK